MNISPTVNFDSDKTCFELNYSETLISFSAPTFPGAIVDELVAKVLLSFNPGALILKIEFQSETWLENTLPKR